MKVQKEIYLILILVFVIAGCSDNSIELFEDYSNVLPKVETVSASMPKNDTVLIVGELLTSGRGSIDVVGFCYHEEHVPDMLDNQIVFVPVDNLFGAELTGFEPNDILYIRTFAANSYGYVYGNTIKYNVPYPTAIDPPCTLNDNTLISDFDYSVGWAFDSENENSYKITISISYSTVLEFRFNEIPMSGVYKTTNDVFFEDNREVIVRIGQNYAFGDSEVYIDVNLTDEIMKIEFCDLVYKYNYSDTEYFISGNIIFDYSD